MSLDDTLEKVVQPLGGPSPVANGWTKLASGPFVAAQSKRPIAASLGGKLFVYGGDFGNGVLASADGASWSALKGNWPARPWPGGAVFDGRLYLVGGEKKADTWASVDGVQWSQIGGAAAWGPRWGQAMTAFKGHLYLLAGVKSERPQDDVWALEPGGTWRLVKSQAFGQRLFAGAGVVGDRLLLLGGLNDLGPIAESVVSTDGVTWTSYPVPWTPRFGSAAVTIGDTLYLVGGQGKQDSGIVFNDVWATQDGIAWSRVDASLPSLTQFAGGAIGGQLVVLGGLAGATPSPDAWGLSPPPAGWRQIGESIVSSHLLYAPTLAYAGKLWALSGNETTSVASSADGVTWTNEPNDLPFRRFAAGTVHNNAMWICGGSDVHGPSNEVRFSTDGHTWKVVTAHADWAPREMHCMESFNGKLFVYAGRTDASQNDVWSSPDGVKWTRETAAAFGERGRASGASAVFGGKLWMLSGELSGNPYQDAWSSADGKTWQKQVTPWSGRYAFGACVIDNMLYVAGGGGSHGTFLKDVWGTRDGVTWSCFADTAPWGDLGGSQYAAWNGALLMFGGAHGDWHRGIYRFQPM